MKKGIILIIVIVLLAVGGFKIFGSKNSFQLKVSNVQIQNNEALVQGVILKGNISNGSIVKIQRDGEIVKSVKILELATEKNGGKSVESASKGEKVYMGFKDISENDLAIEDMLVK